MTILHKDGNGVTNWNNVLRIMCNGRHITAYMADGSNHHIGVYETHEAAMIEFERLFEQLEKKHG